MPLARQLLLLQFAVVLATAAIGALALVATARHRTTEQERQRVLAVARTVAAEPEVAAALTGPDPARVLQPIAEGIRRSTRVAFVVVMGPDRVRYSHPEPDRIGGRFVGRIAPALRGRAFTETYTGTLGRSVRAVAPVRRHGRIVGLVSAGVLLSTVADEMEGQLPALLGLTAVALAIGALGSALVARRLKRQTLGLEPRRIAALYQHQEATLHAIREGLLVVDTTGRLTLANDEARRLLGLPGDAEGRPVEALVPDGPLREILLGRREADDELVLAGDRVLVAGRRDSALGGRPLGTVTTLRDRTELEAIVRELDTVRGLADSLRAQTHESANQLHTLVGLVELGRHEEAIAFATGRVQRAQEELDRLQQRLGDPAAVALLLGKTARGRELGVELLLGPGTDLPAGAVPTAELVTVLGNLVDNALDAVAGRPGARVEVGLRVEGERAVIEVRDNGPGLDAAARERAFEAGWSTKPAGAEGRGLGLALVRQAAERLGGGATVTDAPGGGAVFRVRVPAAAAEPAGPAGAASATGDEPAQEPVR